MSKRQNLPKVAPSHDQEKRSRRAFESLVPEVLFFLRQDKDDYGTDLILELRKDGNLLTNFRSHVQIKSSASSHMHTDGTFSYPISLSNLSYLFNQPNSIVALYLEDRSEMRWAWVSEIYQTAQQKGISIDSTAQETMAYRFSKKLTSDSFEDIHQHILQTGILQRRLNEITAVLASEQDSIMIDLPKQTITSANEIITFLHTNGYSLINRGRIDVIEQYLAKLPESSLQTDKELLCLAAYTKAVSGRMYDALARLPYLESISNPRTKQIAILVQATAKLALTLITRSDYDRALIEARSLAPNSVWAIHSLIEEWRSQLHTSLERSPEILHKINAAIKLLKQAQIGDRHAIGLLEVYELEAETFASNIELIMEYSAARFVQGLNLPWASPADPLSAVARWKNRESEWMQKSNTLFDNAKRLNNPLMQIAVNYQSASFHIIQYTTALMIAADQNTQLPMLTDLFTTIEQDLSDIVQVSTQSKYYTFAIRAGLLRSEALTILGKPHEARKAVGDALNLALENGIDQEVKSAQELLQGHSLFADLKSSLKRKSDPQYQYIMAEMNPEQLELFAQTQLRALSLPPDRLPKLRRLASCVHDIAVQQRDFCRHLEIHENLDHTNSPHTYYALNPPRRCFCNEYGYKSYIETEQWTELIDAFKKTNCISCPKRQPARPSQD